MKSQVKMPQSFQRIASRIFDFGLHVPVIGVFLSIFSILSLFIWKIMIARRLFQLARIKE